MGVISAAWLFAVIVGLFDVAVGVVVLRHRRTLARPAIAAGVGLAIAAEGMVIRGAGYYGPGMVLALAGALCMLLAGVALLTAALAMRKSTR